MTNLNKQLESRNVGIYFYIPEQLWPSPFPDEHDFLWKGYKDGIYCWTLQTYNRLKQAGTECELVSKLPQEGIIISHRGCLSDTLIPTANQLLVCILADWSRHPYAQVHIVQNPYQEDAKFQPVIERLFLKGKNYFVRHWPQARLKPRDPDRGTSLKTIAYFGRRENLAPELQHDSWNDFLKSLGIKWQIIETPDKWNDYSKIDATISIRGFETSRYYFKPATKLYNSWNAGVIPICGDESAIFAETRNYYDCIIAHNMDELKNSISCLANNEREREKYFSASIKKSQFVSTDSITTEWKRIIKERLVPDYLEWGNKPYLARSWHIYTHMIGKATTRLADTIRTTT